MKVYDNSHLINIGTGVDHAIAEIAYKIKDVVSYKGTLNFDPAYPDGTPRKLLDVSRLSVLGWEAKTELEDGLTMTYRWYCDNVKQVRLA
jgi:GDP-L-fucose synthase